MLIVLIQKLCNSLEDSILLRFAALQYPVKKCLLLVTGVSPNEGGGSWVLLYLFSGRKRGGAKGWGYSVQNKGWTKVGLVRCTKR